MKLFLLVVLASACGSSKKCDMSSDGSLARLVGLEGTDLCVQRSKTFGVALVGTLVADLGCDYTHTVYQCGVDDPTTQARAMSAAGWEQADAAGRARLGYAWLRELVAGNGTILEEDSPDFPVAGKSFSPPGFEPIEGGGVRLRYWTSRSRGMLPGSRYILRETVFNKDGLIISGRDMDQFETKQ